MTTIILGAGATRGAEPVNPRFLPPLLLDLKDIPSCDSVSLNQTQDGPLFAEGFDQLIKACGLEQNIEEFLSIMFVLEIIAENINPKFVFLTTEQINHTLEKSESLKDLFPKQAQRNAAVRILSFLRDESRYSLFLYPKNLRTFFHSALRDYFAVCLFNCYCRYHAKLFDQLELGDSVISFNYDEIADYSLHQIGKLTPASLEGLGFSDIVLPRNQYPNSGVNLLKVHGSFNWWTEIEHFSRVFYCLMPQSGSKAHLGNTFFPIVLPSSNKRFFYARFPVLHFHQRRMLESIARANQLFIVGKSFWNADRELCQDIAGAAKGRHRELYIIDLAIDRTEFLRANEEVFSGSVIRTWQTLQDFYNDRDF